MSALVSARSVSLTNAYKST